jgi:dihydroneopterin aldolase
MDAITLRGITAWGCHGVYTQERERAQPFEIDLVLELDLSAAARSDDVKDTVDYAVLHAAIIEIVETRSYALLERLAAELLECALRDPRVNCATVSIAKPHVLAGTTPVVTMKWKNPR